MLWYSEMHIDSSVPTSRTQQKVYTTNKGPSGKKEKFHQAVRYNIICLPNLKIKRDFSEHILEAIEG